MRACFPSIFVVSFLLGGWQQQQVESFLNNNPRIKRIPVESVFGISSWSTTITGSSKIQLASTPKDSSFSSSPFERNNNQEPSRRRKKRKTLQDRTQTEVIGLAQDIIKTIVEAGPRAGPARTFQAYLAFTDTLREFLPLLTTTTTRSSGPSNFSVPRVLRSLFERLGATYIKLGQFIASSPTLFPKEYVVEFQKCLDATDPLEWSVIQNVIESELGPISRTFSYVDRKPLASASIAQVHAAKLKTGEDVVIKVQKPGIDDCLKADLGFIYIASRLVEFWQPDWERTSLSAVAGDIRNSMLEELDFDKEATNMEEFRQFLREYDLLQVATAPRVYRDFTTKKVLTMERLRGVSLLDEKAISKITKDPENTIITALNVWTMSVMRMPWFHADVHAGNLLVLEDGRVGFIDFGIVGRVSEKTFRAVNELSTAMSMNDYEGMAVALCNMGATEEQVNTKEFGRDIQRVMQNLSNVQPERNVASMPDGTVRSTLDFDDNEVTNILLEIVDVTENNGLRLPREFGLLVKQSLYFDRYLKILAPNLNVMTDSRIELGTVNGDSTVANGDPGPLVLDAHAKKYKGNIKY